MPRQRRPPDDEYFDSVASGDPWRQGDLIQSVPFLVGDTIDDFVPERDLQPAGSWWADVDAGAPPRLAGPCWIGTAVLVSPDVYLERVQPSGITAVTLMPVTPVTDIDEIGPDALADLIDYDDLLHYMYLPASPDIGLAKSVLRLSLASSIDIRIVHDQRVARLTTKGRQQLKRKLAHFFSGLDQMRGMFPP